MRKRNPRRNRQHEFITSSSSSGETETISSESEPGYTESDYDESPSPVIGTGKTEPHRPASLNRTIPLPSKDPPFTPSLDFDDPPDYDIVQTHSRLETIEARITSGRLPGFRHRAQVIEADDKVGSSISTNAAEEEKFCNYRTTIWSAPRPQFWVPRPWEAGKEPMSEEASKELQEGIEELMKTNLPTEDGEFQRPKRRERRPKMMLVLSKLDFLTDHMDEQTDYEFDW